MSYHARRGGVRGGDHRHRTCVEAKGARSAVKVGEESLSRAGVKPSGDVEYLFGQGAA